MQVGGWVAAGLGCGNPGLMPCCSPNALQRAALHWMVACSCSPRILPARSHARSLRSSTCAATLLPRCWSGTATVLWWPSATWSCGGRASCWARGRAGAACAPLSRWGAEGWGAWAGEAVLGLCGWDCLAPPRQRFAPPAPPRQRLPACLTSSAALSSSRKTAWLDPIPPSRPTSSSPLLTGRLHPRRPRAAGRGAACGLAPAGPAARPAAVAARAGGAGGLGKPAGVGHRQPALTGVGPRWGDMRQHCKARIATLPPLLSRYLVHPCAAMLPFALLSFHNIKPLFADPIILFACIGSKTDEQRHYAQTTVHGTASGFELPKMLSGPDAHQVCKASIRDAGGLCIASKLAGHQAAAAGKPTALTTVDRTAHSRPAASAGARLALVLVLCPVVRLHASRSVWTHLGTPGLRRPKAVCMFG